MGRASGCGLVGQRKKFKRWAMSKLGDHHYIPQFHLNCWADGDGKLTQWGRAPFTNKLFKKRVSSAETGYKPGLYAVSAASPQKQQMIEREVFGRLDNASAMVMQKLLRGDNISLVERATWAFYLNASVIRVAHIVEKMRREMQILIKEELDRDLPDYNEVRGDVTAATLYEWGIEHDSDRISNAGLQVLIRLLQNERALNRIINLNWTVRDVSSTSNRLMLSDDPVHREVPLYARNACWIVPLSPTHIFLAADDHNIIDRFHSLTPRALVQQSNIRSLRNARQFAYGAANCSFIERHLLVASTTFS